MNYRAPELLSSTRFLVSWPQTGKAASGPNLLLAGHAEPLFNSSSWWEMSVKYARPDTYLTLNPLVMWVLWFVATFAGFLTFR